MNGFDQSSTALSLAKQLLMECDGVGSLTLPKETLKIVLTSFVEQWKGEQDRKRSEFKKAVV